jgi:hypothetical protein
MTMAEYIRYIQCYIARATTIEVNDYDYEYDWSY